MNLKKLLTIYFCFSISTVFVFSQYVPEDERRIGKLLERIFVSEFKEESRPLFGFQTGMSWLSFPDNAFTDNFAKAYRAEIIYGFQRIEKIKQEPSLIRHSSEFVALANISSHLKPKSIAIDGNTTDSWRITFGLSNGYGYSLDNADLMLNHTGAFTINRIDVEYPATNNINQQILNRFDEKYKFGSYFHSGVSYRISGILFITGGYEHSIVFPDTHFGKWLAGWLIENISQRWIDIVEPYMFDIHKLDFPWIIFTIKTIISFVHYELRRYEMFWPLNSSVPLNYDSFRIGMTLVF
jgi:hypothetical protein